MLKIGKRTGFTLIELLIVIAIIAILSVVVILALNPAELLKQARDSNRISDMSTLKNALSLYVADGNTTLDNASGTGTAYARCLMSSSTAPQSADCGSWFSTAYATVTSTGNRAVNGGGWLPVNLSAISSGSPVPQLPVDPINNNVYYYAYGATSTNSAFKFATHMESTKYKNGGNSDVETTDGGTGGASSSVAFEVGSNLAL